MTNAPCEQSRLTPSGRTVPGYRPQDAAMRFFRQVGAALARRRAESRRRKRIAAMERLMASLPLATQRDVGWPKRYFEPHSDDAE